MKCHEITEKIEAFIFSETAPEVTAEIQAHIESCPECRKKVKETREIIASLREALITETAPEELDETRITPLYEPPVYKPVEPQKPEESQKTASGPSLFSLIFKEFFSESAMAPVITGLVVFVLGALFFSTLVTFTDKNSRSGGGCPGITVPNSWFSRKDSTLPCKEDSATIDFMCKKSTDRSAEVNDQARKEISDLKPAEEGLKKPADRLSGEIRADEGRARNEIKRKYLSKKDKIKDRGGSWNKWTVEGEAGRDSGKDRNYNGTVPKKTRLGRPVAKPKVPALVLDEAGEMDDHLETENDMDMKSALGEEDAIIDIPLSGKKVVGAIGGGSGGQGRPGPAVKGKLPKSTTSTESTRSTQKSYFNELKKETALQTKNSRGRRETRTVNLGKEAENRKMEFARAEERKMLKVIEVDKLKEDEESQKTAEMPVEEKLDPAKPVPVKIPAFNPFQLTDQDPLSTFSIDVDTASFSIARAHILDKGMLPPPDSVRCEEFINTFDYQYAPPVSSTFTVYTEAAPSLVNPDLHLLKIGVKGREPGRETRKRANLTILVDASGSMETRDRMDLVKESVKMMINKLNPRDRVSLIAYGTRPFLMAEAVPVARKKRLFTALDRIQPGGSTNMLAGLKAAYGQAAHIFESNQINRIIFCTDGIATVGPADAREILAQVKSAKKYGITLTCAGFGTGMYDDATIKKIAMNSDGNYVFIDSKAEAKRVFVDQFSATMHVIAENVKIQVAFNPQRVRRFRQVGYEKRKLAHQDFRNDKVDAGEVGSGQSVTALYEVELTGTSDLSIGQVHVRYRNPENGFFEEISHTAGSQDLKKSWKDTAAGFRLAACAAGFAEILRKSPWVRPESIGTIKNELQRLNARFPLDKRIEELYRMVQQAEHLE